MAESLLCRLSPSLWSPLCPHTFNSVADMVEWILIHSHNVPDLLHYLDDFITAGPPNSDQCARNLNTSVTVCHSLGLPRHSDKCLGPSSVLVVLGIELDSNEQVARLPADKFVALQQVITSWLSCRWCTRNQLESLIGHLHHAAKVVWPCLLYTSPSPRDLSTSRMPSSA